MIGLVRKISSHLYVPLGWTVITIILLCLPGSAIPKVGISWFSNIDKLVHFLLFGFIPVFWIYYVVRSGRKPGWIQSLVFLAIGSIALGIVLEYVQFYIIPNRDFDVWDIVADSTGAIVCSLVVFAIEAKRR